MDRKDVLCAIGRSIGSMYGSLDPRANSTPNPIAMLHYHLVVSSWR